MAGTRLIGCSCGKLISTEDFKIILDAVQMLGLQAHNTLTDNFTLRWYRFLTLEFMATKSFANLHTRWLGGILI